MATLEIPDPINFPRPETEREEELYKILNDYFTQLGQVLSEIESKLP